MADAIPMLRREQRRHLLMNGWLIAGFIIVGTAVTNERGIFRPVGVEGISANAMAFIAMASPTNLGPRLRDVRSVSGLNPFQVTAPPRDVQRRLADAIGFEPGDVPGQQPLGFGTTPVPTNLADASSAVPPIQPASFGGPPAPLGVSNPTLPTNAGTPLSPPATTPPAFETPPTQIGVPGTPTSPPTDIVDTPGIGAVPEPATWAMLILGFGIVGGMLRAVKQGLGARSQPVVRRRRRREDVAA